MFEGNQAATRQEEDSKVLVRWTDTLGKPFTERTETRDISETGISFYLESPIWLDTHLNLHRIERALRPLAYNNS